MGVVEEGDWKDSGIAYKNGNKIIDNPIEHK